MQVISGGHYDVDCSVQDPLGNPVYRETRKQYDSFTHHAAHAGVYQFCFSNEFSTFSHKVVYFDFQVGDEPPILPEMGGKVTALTQVSGPVPAPACSHLGGQPLSTWSPSTSSPSTWLVPVHLIPVHQESCGLWYRPHPRAQRRAWL